MEVEKYSADLIFSHFKNLNEAQQHQIESLYEMYREWNEKINIISRKDFENLYLKHILHSLAIAKFLTFTNESKILDVGTGGGFPGIPLAILFPHVQFHLVDSIGKKIKIVDFLDNNDFFHYDFLLLRMIVVQATIHLKKQANTNGQLTATAIIILPFSITKISRLICTAFVKRTISYTSRLQ